MIMEEPLLKFDLSDINRGISTIENGFANTLNEIRDQPDNIQRYHEIVKGEIYGMIEWIKSLVQVYHPLLTPLKRAKEKENKNDKKN
jgi:hypothetical protein